MAAVAPPLAAYTAPISGADYAQMYGQPSPYVAPPPSMLDRGTFMVHSTVRAHPNRTAVVVAVLVVAVIVLLFMVAGARNSFMTRNGLAKQKFCGGAWDPAAKAQAAAFGEIGALTPLPAGDRGARRYNAALGGRGFTDADLAAIL